MDNYSIDYEDRIVARRLLLLVVVGIIVIISAHFADRLITGNATVVKLPSAPSLLGQVIQSGGSPSNQIAKLSGYRIRDTHYFDNNDWVITTFIPPNNEGEDNTVILQKIGQFYQVVIGPGTSFSSNIVNGLPTDMVKYLNGKGLVYNAS